MKTIDAVQEAKEVKDVVSRRRVLKTIGLKALALTCRYQAWDQSQSQSSLTLQCRRIFMLL